MSNDPIFAVTVTEKRTYLIEAYNQAEAISTDTEHLRVFQEEEFLQVRNAKDEELTSDDINYSL